MKYPYTKKIDAEDTFFGKKIKDPYRWLEDADSHDAKKWLSEQLELTESIIDEFPHRRNIKQRLKELYDYIKLTPPYKWGKYYYFLKNEGLQDQSVYYRKESRDSEESEVFFDPNTLSEDGTTQAFLSGRSRDERYFAFNISNAGSDWSNIRIIDTETKQFLPDKIEKIRSSNAEWYKDGFFYTAYKGGDKSGQDINPIVFYHKLGDDQENDRLIYENSHDPYMFHHAQVSDDEKYLFIHSSKGTYGRQILWKQLDGPEECFKVLFDGFSNEYRIYDSYEEDVFFVETDHKAPNHRLFKVNMKHIGDGPYMDIIPERDYKLDDICIGGGRIIAVYLKDIASLVEVFDTEGKHICTIELPYMCIAYTGISKKEDDTCYLYLSSYTRPTEVYSYDIKDNKLEFYHRSPVKINSDDYVSKQVFFPSKDGTLVPMFINHRKGIERNGNNPVYMYGYGGFDWSILPYLNLGIIPFIDNGGIYVVVNLRGGGEYGDKWHKDGMLYNKQNVFDDFIYAAEYLIEQNYTGNDKIAIVGGSNGGLLVGACMVQRPELFKVAVPQVGVLDMLRFHKFTIGWGWIVEYGDPEKEEDFNYILKYSPLHNISKGVKYPHTLVTTAINDNRVVPGHSFKFVAELQDKASPETVQLLYAQDQSGHGSSNLSKSYEMQADVLSFIFKYLGMEFDAHKINK